jgi:hypothetical protein
MNRMQAVALVQYLQRCVGIIPTTGAEWDGIRPALEVIEAVANGRMELVEGKNPMPAEVRSAAAE